MASTTAEKRRPRYLAVDGEAFERELAARCLDGEALAAAAGVTHEAITRLRRGQVVDRPILRKVLDVLDAMPVSPTLVRVARPELAERLAELVLQNRAERLARGEPTDE